MKTVSRMAAAIAAITVATAVLGVGAFAKARMTLTGQQIMDRAMERYAQCKTYSDSGKVSTCTSFGPESTMSIEGAFSSAFIRPSRYRFEFKGTMITDWDNRKRRVPIHFIAWGKDKEFAVFSSASKSQIQKMDRLDSAVAAATGLSGGIATSPYWALGAGESTPHLLGEGIKKYRRLNDVSVDGRPTFCVEVKADIGLTRLWIDRKTYSILKARIEGPLSNTTTWTPRFDEEVPAAALEFNPPAGATR